MLGSVLSLPLGTVLFTPAVHLVLAITSVGRGGDGKSRSEVYFSPLLEGLVGTAASHAQRV